MLKNKIWLENVSIKSVSDCIVFSVGVYKLNGVLSMVKENSMVGGFLENIIWEGDIVLLLQGLLAAHNSIMHLCKMMTKVFSSGIPL